MEEKQKGMAHYSPEKLLAVFTKGRIAFWVLVAAAVHVVFIGLTSMGYIRDTWIDKEGADARKAAAVAQAQAEKAKLAPKAPAAAVSNVAPSKPVSGTSTGAEDRIMAERKDTPMIKRITEKAGTNEIPKATGEIGISIDDTNPR